MACMYVLMLCILHTYQYYTYVGAVFRHNNTGARSFSSNGVGSGSISWQGYEVITGRIFSPDFGINKIKILIIKSLLYFI